MNHKKTPIKVATYGEDVRNHSESEYRELLVEYQTIQKKLDNKIEALLNVSEGLAHCQGERDKYKARSDMFEQRITDLNKDTQQLQQGLEEREGCMSIERERLMSTLNSVQRENKVLLLENANLSEQLKELQGDIKLIRQKMARLELGPQYEELMGLKGGSRGGSSSGEGVKGDSSLPLNDVSEDSVFSETNDASLQEIEKLREQTSQLERDLRCVLCEKEELVCDRDAYKTKCDRLAQELSFIMSGDENRMVGDVDTVLAENRFLKAQLESAQEETGLTRQTLNKYRTLVDKKKVNPSPAEIGGATKTPLNIVTPKQVRELLNNSSLPDTDYRTLTSALYEAVHDKTLALSHQRKANKILGLRVTELECRLRVFEENKSPNKNMDHPPEPNGPHTEINGPPFDLN